MIQQSTFRQTNSFAMQYGLFFGLFWVLGFAATIGSIRGENLSILSLFTFFTTPILGWVFLRKYSNNATPKGTLPFGTAYLFSFLLYFYAAIILSASTFIYFAYMDNGVLLQSYQEYLNKPEVQEILSTPQFSKNLQEIGINNKADFQNAIASLQDISPITWAINILDTNIFFGMLLSFPTALTAIGFKKKRKSF